MAHIPRGTHVISVTGCCGAHPTKVMCQGLIFCSKNLHVKVKISPKVAVCNDNITAAARIFYYVFSNKILMDYGDMKKYRQIPFFPLSILLL